MQYPLVIRILITTVSEEKSALDSNGAALILNSPPFKLLTSHIKKIGRQLKYKQMIQEITKKPNHQEKKRKFCLTPSEPFTLLAITRRRSLISGNGIFSFHYSSSVFLFCMYTNQTTCTHGETAHNYIKLCRNK